MPLNLYYHINIIDYLFKVLLDVFLIHMFNLGVSQDHLPPRIFFSRNAEFGEKDILGQPPNNLLGINMLLFLL